MRLIINSLLLILPTILFSQTPSAEKILIKVDKNRIADGKIIVSKMIIHGRRGERTVESKTWQRNLYDSFSEYLAPPREKGTKMLKLGDQLWTYSPSTDRTILISGHMLRQSVMGSDLSYEDLMEDPYFQHNYTAEIVGSDTVSDRPVWILDLKAKTEDISYEKCKLWVDKDRYIPLKENLYAKSGKLLKTIDINEAMNVDGRWILKSAVYKDVLKEGGGTNLIIESIKFDDHIPEYIFSKASLRR
jgi:outer membrane lipoprotein-sorting protein